MCIDAKQVTACEQDFHGLLEFPTAWPERPRFCGLSCFFTLARGSHKESCAAPWDFASSRDASNSYRTASNILMWHVLMSCIMNLAGQVRSQRCNHGGEHLGFWRFWPSTSNCSWTPRPGACHFCHSFGLYPDEPAKRTKTRHFSPLRTVTKMTSSGLARKKK